jgi:hypothetical protein
LLKYARTAAEAIQGTQALQLQYHTKKLSSCCMHLREIEMYRMQTHSLTFVLPALLLRNAVVDAPPLLLPSLSA